MANWRLFAGLALVVALVSLVFIILLYALTGGDVPFDHGVILDAGSSHTEALLYQWHGSKRKGTGYVEQLHKCHVEDGISSFALPEEAGASLIPCLQEMANKVPEDKRAKTPVYLGATAGMRLLNKSKPFMNLATFTAIRCALPMSGLKIETIGIISGQDEGIFAWITTNFLLGTLKRKQDPTVGALDMGGASTQIAFEVDEEYKDNSEVKTLQLYGEKYHVYSTTYLCYGAFEIYRRYHSMLVQDPENRNTILSPCSHKNHQYTWDAKFLFDAPCTKTKETQKWAFLNPDKLKNYNYSFLGTSDPAACRDIVRQIFDKEECKQKYEECFEPIQPMRVSEKFVALSSYAYTMGFIKAKNSSLTEFREKLQQFCQKDWQEVTTPEYIAPVKKALPRFCLQGQAVDQILTSGYGFNETTWSNLQFTTNLNKTSVGWALGYMINATNAIPSDSPSKAAISTPVFIVLLIGCFILFGIGILFCIRSRKMKKRTTNGP